MLDNGFKGNNIENEPAYTLVEGDVSNWSEETDGSWSATGKTYTGNDGGFDITIYDNFSSSDFLMRADISVTSGSNYGFVFGYIDANNYYYYDIGTNEFHGVYGGVDNDLAHLNPDGTADGSTVRIWRDGREIAIAIGAGDAPDYMFENTHTVGKCGLFVNNANVDFGNFEIFSANKALRHFSPTRVTMMEGMNQLRLLSFSANINGADFHIDRNKNLNWRYRDYNAPSITEIKEGVNILGGSVFRDYGAVRNKVSVRGSSGNLEIPDTTQTSHYFYNGEDWFDTGNWHTWDPQSTLIQMNESDEETTGWNLYPNTAAGRNLNIPTSTYDQAQYQMQRVGGVTNYSVDIRFYEDGATFVEDNHTDAGGGGAGVWTDLTTDISGIDTVNFIGLQITCGTLIGGDPMSARLRNLKFNNSGENTNFLITSTDADTPFSETIEYEETNTTISSINSTIDYVKAQLALRKIARWKGSIRCEGSSIYKAGRNVKGIIPSAGLDQVVNISSAVHTLNNRGYFTTITIDEIEALIAEELSRSRSAVNESRNRDIAENLTTITV
jgi:hypothetical protein